MRHSRERLDNSFPWVWSLTGHLIPTSDVERIESATQRLLYSTRENFSKTWRYVGESLNFVQKTLVLLCFSHAVGEKTFDTLIVDITDEEREFWDLFLQVCRGVHEKSRLREDTREVFSIILDSPREVSSSYLHLLVCEEHSPLSREVKSAVHQYIRA